MTDPAKHSLVQLWLFSALLVQRKNLAKFADFNVIYETLNRYFDNFVPKQILTEMERFYNLVDQYTEYLLSE